MSVVLGMTQNTNLAVYLNIFQKGWWGQKNHNIGASDRQQEIFALFSSYSAFLQRRGSAAVAIRRVRKHFVAMAGTGYDEKQSGQLLLLEHHYKPFFGQRFCMRQRESILYRQNKSWVIFTCTKKKPYFSECYTAYTAYQTKETPENRRELSHCNHY